MNPYLQLYEHFCITTRDPLNKEAAQKISANIAQLHNALGHAISDLMRMLATQFSKDGNSDTSKEGKQTCITAKAVSPASSKSSSKSQQMKTQSSLFSDPSRKKDDARSKPLQAFNQSKVLRISERMEDIEDSSSERKSRN